MFRQLLQTGQIEVDARIFVVHYFELRTARGGRRYSCEIVLDPRDRIILDDDSMMSLESKMERLVPATVYSRMLAGTPSEAA